MNSPKVVLSLGAILIFSVLMTACGGGGKAPKPPAGPPTIQTVLLPQGAVNLPYFMGKGAILSATGGTGTYTWSIASGSLPPGLTLDPSLGLISGIPTALGNYIFTVQVTDGASMSSQKNLSIYIEGVVSITPAALPTGAPNVPYTNSNGTPVQLMATGGLTPYTWCVVESIGTCDDGTFGALPPGLSLNKSSGVISGTPVTDGLPTTFTVQVSDSETSPGVPAVGTSTFNITIMSIVTVSLPSGYLNVPYSAAMTVAGGVQPYTWTATNLPPGLALDPATCTGSKGPMCSIKGTPTTPGSYPMTVTVTDGEKSNRAVATASLTINVFQSQLTITTISLPAGIVGIAYSVTLGATGGTPPYTWSLTSGTLPPGLMLDGNTGVISGTPTAANTYGFTLQVADSGTPQQSVNGTFSILINPAITNAALNGNYVFTFSGYNNGTPVLMAGSFVADGNGNITSGVLDYNDGTGEPVDGNPIPQTIGTGSVYNITPNGLGTMTLTTNLAVFQLAVAIKGDGTGRLIQSDPANKQAYGSGQIKANTPLSQGQQWPLCGAYVAVGFFGFDHSLVIRYAGAGQFQFDPTTCVDPENGVMDIDDGGTPSSATFHGAFNRYDNPTSRGIAGFTINGARLFHAFYLVSNSDHKKNDLVLVSTDPASKPAPLTLWSGLQQASSAQFGPNNWNNLALAGTGVAELNALDSGVKPDVTAGLFAGQGQRSNSCQSGPPDPATFSYDENQGGASSLLQTSTGTYCADKATGRVTLTSFTGQFGQFPPVFYLVSANQAFVVGTDPAVTSGYLEQQTGPPFTNGSISGPYDGGTVAPITSAVTNAASYLFADAGGNINGSGNTSGPAGPGTTNFSYTYSVDATGRTVVQQNGNPIGVLYVVSPQKFVMLPTTTDPSPALSVFNQ